MSCSFDGGIHLEGFLYGITGDLVFDCGGVRVGIEICRDAWVDDRPAPRLAARARSAEGDRTNTEAARTLRNEHNVLPIE